MSGYERSPLTGAELFPKRVTGGSMQTVEKLLFYGGLALGLASGCVCIAFGALYHIQHLLMGVAILAIGGLFFYMMRQYMKDDLQDRRLIFIMCFILFFVSITGILYAVEFQKAKDPYKGCTGWFLPPSSLYPNGVCSPTIPHNLPVPVLQSCYKFISAGTSSSSQLNAYLLPGLSNLNATSRVVPCLTAQNWVKTCTGYEPSWKCP